MGDKLFGCSGKYFLTTRKKILLQRVMMHNLLMWFVFSFGVFFFSTQVEKLDSELLVSSFITAFICFGIVFNVHKKRIRAVLTYLGSFLLGVTCSGYSTIISYDPFLLYHTIGSGVFITLLGVYMGVRACANLSNCIRMFVCASCIVFISTIVNLVYFDLPLLTSVIGFVILSLLVYSIMASTQRVLSGEDTDEYISCVRVFISTFGAIVHSILVLGNNNN